VSLILGCVALVPRASSAAPATAAFAPATQAATRPSQAAVLAPNTVARLDVPYGADPKQMLDIYAPKGASDAPVVVYVHGGEWTRGDKAEISYKPAFLNAHGIVLISINYRLSPAWAHPAQVDDVASSIAWVKAHAAELGASPRRIILMGHSAGCHLVTLVALDPRVLARAGLKPSDLAGVVAWSGGSYDLVDKVRSASSYAPYIRQTFGDAEAAWRDASPIAHVKDFSPLPGFLFVSAEKGNASEKAAQNLASLIQSAGGEAATHTLENRTHFTSDHLLGAPEDTTGRLLLDFINEPAHLQGNR